MTRIGVCLEDDDLKLFRQNLRKHNLKLSPVLNALVQLFNNKFEGEIDGKIQSVCDPLALRDL
jgi:hypothetical protein